MICAYFHRFRKANKVLVNLVFVLLSLVFVPGSAEPPDSQDHDSQQSTEREYDVNGGEVSDADQADGPSLEAMEVGSGGDVSLGLGPVAEVDVCEDCGASEYISHDSDGGVVINLDFEAEVDFSEQPDRGGSSVGDIDFSDTSATGSANGGPNGVANPNDGNGSFHDSGNSGGSDSYSGGSGDKFTPGDSIYDAPGFRDSEGGEPDLSDKDMLESVVNYQKHVYQKEKEFYSKTRDKASTRINERTNNINSRFEAEKFQLTSGGGGKKNSAASHNSNHSVVSNRLLGLRYLINDIIPTNLKEALAKELLLKIAKFISEQLNLGDNLSAESAAEALDHLVGGIRFAPGTSEVYDFFDAITAIDLDTGEPQSISDRTIIALGIIPFIKPILKGSGLNKLLNRIDSDKVIGKAREIYDRLSRKNWEKQFEKYGLEFPFRDKVKKALDYLAEKKKIAENWAGTRWANNRITARISGILRDAAKGKGNFGLGSASYDEAMVAGKAWVGQNYTVSKNGKAYVSEDKRRQFRLPSEKVRLGKKQANFEWRSKDSGRFQGNGHLDIID